MISLVKNEKERDRGENTKENKEKEGYRRSTANDQDVLVLFDARSGELGLVLLHELDYMLNVVTTHISPKLANEEDEHPKGGIGMVDRGWKRRDMTHFLPLISEPKPTSFSSSLKTFISLT